MPPAAGGILLIALTHPIDPTDPGVDLCPALPYVPAELLPIPETLMSMPSLLRFVIPACCMLTLIFTALPVTAAQTPQTTVRAPLAGEGNAAAETDSAKLAAARAAMKADATPVSLEHDGTDTLGAKLTMLLKETFNTGTLLALNDSDVPKLQMFITTAPEFSSRPAVGSVYSVIWVYSERSNVLSNYLAHESGILTPEDLDGLAARLASRTAGIAAKHSYIFKK